MAKSSGKRKIQCMSCGEMHHEKKQHVCAASSLAVSGYSAPLPVTNNVLKQAWRK